MALVLSLAIGDVVDIAEDWVAVNSVESRNAATLVTKNGQKIPISSKYETEIMPAIWVQLGCGLISPYPEPDRSQLDEGEVIGSELVISGGNTPALLDLVEEPLDQVT